MTVLWWHDYSRRRKAVCFAAMACIGMLWGIDGFVMVPRVVSPPRPFRTQLFAINNREDPFRILNLEPDPGLDKKAIKRAYKRMALKFHPDVVTNQNSTNEEKEKANEAFARINWAYETLTGKNKEESTASTSTTSSSSGYTPPHRRSGGAYSQRKRTASQPGASTDWRDYMPNYDDEDYDAGGDSFGAIFSDLFTAGAGAVAGGAVGGGGIFKDLVDFLERNVEGYSGGADDDAQLSILLQTGSVQDIGMEMDDTELVVQQLSSKIDNIEQELMTVTAQAQQTSRYLEKLELEESEEELKARKRISEGYLKKARERLIKLQTRYKQLIVNGENDFSVGGGSRRTTTSSSWDSGTGTRTERKKASSGEDDGDSWKHEGFGSSGRGRGSGRRRSRSRRAGAAERESTNTARTQRESTADSFSGRSAREEQYGRKSPPETTSRTSSTDRRSSPTPSRSSEPWTPPVPPHRRTQSQVQADKRRLRELQVDEDFDKLKKDLGL